MHKSEKAARVSGSNYYRDQDELAAAAGMCTRQLRKYTKRDGFPAKTKSGYPKEKCLAFIKEVQDSGLKGDGSLRDEKLLREIDKLDIQIEEMRGELVNRREEEQNYFKELSGIRKQIDDWEAHETAKHPEQAEIIAGLAGRLIDGIRERTGE